MLTDQEIEAILGFNPAPGSPSVMWDLQHRVADRASTLTAASDGLSGVTVDTWIGHGADSFEGTLGNLRRDVHTAAGAHSDYASAVYAYVSEQESAKTQTQSLAQQALQAHQAHQAALNHVTRYSTVPTSETDAARTDREQNLRSAQGQASTAQGDFDAIVRRARALQQHMETVASQAVQRINAAAELAPYEQPGWLQQAWSDVTTAAGAVWHFVSSPGFLHDLSLGLNIVSAVCAFIPGLQGVAIAAAVLAVGIDLLAKLAAGEPINWLSVGFDAALAFIPGGRLARVFKGIPAPFRGAVMGAVIGSVTSGARDLVEGRGFNAADIGEGAAFGAVTGLVGSRVADPGPPRVEVGDNVSWNPADHQLGPDGLPAFDGNNTYGRMKIGDQEYFIKNGQGEPGIGARTDPNIKAGAVAPSHVEGHAGMIVRQTGVTDATLTINHPKGPCGFCDKVVSNILPEGSSLTVNWPNGSVTFPGKG
jgi:hypothetical protein